MSPTEHDAYAQQGFFVRERALDVATVSALRDAVEGIHTRISVAAATAAAVEQVDDTRFQEVLGSTIKWEWEQGSPHIRSMEPVFHLDTRIAALHEDPRLVEPAEELIGAPVGPFTDKLNFKRPGGSPFPWHQDTPYWAFGCDHVDRLASVQIYLDEATKENGCLSVLPGSQRHGRLPVFRDRGTLGRLYTDLEHLTEGEPFAIEAPPGTAIFFHGDVVHGSDTNRTSSSRRALILTFQPAGHPRWNRGRA